jgi:FtsH-binding integral membrane protein
MSSPPTESEPSVPSFQTSTTPSAAFGAERAERTFLRQVFAWMFAALALTTAIAVWFHSSTSTLAYFADHRGLFIAAIVAQVGLVIVLSGAINRVSAQTAAILFFLYAGLTGVVFSILLDAYTTTSVVGAFAGAAGVFAGMALYGYATERDLSGLRGILFGALIGIIVASVVFMFVGGSTFNLIIGWAGVIIFSALTAYDMQSLKNLRASGTITAENDEKLAIFGALRLYLDFINLFISLLRIFGSSR